MPSLQFYTLKILLTLAVSPARSFEMIKHVLYTLEIDSSLPAQSGPPGCSEFNINKTLRCESRFISWHLHLQRALILNNWWATAAAAVAAGALQVRAGDHILVWCIVRGSWGSLWEQRSEERRRWIVLLMSLQQPRVCNPRLQLRPRVRLFMLNGIYVMSLHILFFSSGAARLAGRWSPRAGGEEMLSISQGHVM